jgi:hypothetical protein
MQHIHGQIDTLGVNFQGEISLKRQRQHFEKTA